MPRFENQDVFFYEIGNCAMRYELKGIQCAVLGLFLNVILGGLE